MAFLMERLRPAAVVLGDPAAARTGLVGGAAAAGLGFAGLAVPLFLLWIVTPYVQVGPGGALHLAACLWLLAQGAGLLRPDGAPLALPPLLVTVLVLLPLYRFALRAGTTRTDAAERAEGAEEFDDFSDDFGDDFGDETGDESEDEAGVREPGHPGSALLGLAAGYLLATLAIVVAAAADTPGGLRAADPLAALGHTALLALPVAAVGVHRGSGARGLPAWLHLPVRPRLPAWVRWPDRAGLPGWARRFAPNPDDPDGPEDLDGPDASGRWGALPTPNALEALYAPGGPAVALRAALCAGAALLGAGAVLLAAALLLHFGAAGGLAAQTAPDLAGRLSLLLLCIVLLPNGAVWAAAYALGPGFQLGGRLAPLTVAVPPAPPAFPLLSALPTAGGGLSALLVLAVPVASAAAVSGCVGRAAERCGWRAVATAGVALGAAVGTGVLAAVCAAASGGSLGTRALAAVGPSPWWTGLAALCWAAAGVPGALLVRLVLSRRSAPTTAEASASPWWRSCCRRPW
ncbi:MULTISPECIES: DUF6350 family protein [Streptacidiphilus]|uniref:DUF6350 family protein n=1 Tax=Streptacidiphilus cavernicola TaxID=3342716 RepID=A0ABV6USK6_9ACTN|nr:DUF6350 family protein [Streptacidiphilus jeojiense]